jgi:hypothetical protein
MTMIDINQIYKSPSKKFFYTICQTQIRINGQVFDGICIRELGKAGPVITTSIEEFNSKFTKAFDASTKDV